VERELTIRSNDADEAVFTVNLRGQGRLPTIGGRIFEDANGDGSYSLGDSALDDQRVFIDSNDNDTYDEGWINQINETDVTISDYRTVTSTVTISGVDTRMPWTYVQVYVNIEHTYTGDLTLKLKNPAGQSITLASRSINPNRLRSIQRHLSPPRTFVAADERQSQRRVGALGNRLGWW
jgi:hypothetical protein